MAEQFILDLPFRPAQGRDDFMVSACNDSAVALIDSWPDWRAPVCVLHGPPASGKSHLGAIWREKSGASEGDISGITEQAAHELARRPALLVDYPPDTVLDETGLFHWLNGLQAAGGTALICARDVPARWPLTFPDLKTRLSQVLTAEIGAPDDALLSAVLMKHLRDRQISDVDSRLIPYLLVHMDRSFDAARQLVAEMDAATFTTGRRLTVPLAREILERRRG